MISLIDAGSGQRVTERAELVARIYALEREASEIPELRLRIAELERENSELRKELERLRAPAPKVEVGAPLFTFQITGAKGTVTRSFQQHSIKLGRAPTCDLVIDDQDASRMHAVLDPAGPKLSDLASTSGTFVNGKRITATTLQRGDTIQIGRTSLVVTWK